MNNRNRIRAVARFYTRPTEADGSVKLRCPVHQGMSTSLHIKPAPGGQDRNIVRCYGHRCDPGEIEWRIYIHTGVRVNNS